jgi:hypothetical protein
MIIWEIWVVEKQIYLSLFYNFYKIVQLGVPVVLSALLTDDTNGEDFGNKLNKYFSLTYNIDSINNISSPYFSFTSFV